MTVQVNLRNIGAPIDVAPTLLARDYKGFDNHMMAGVVEWG